VHGRWADGTIWVKGGADRLVVLGVGGTLGLGGTRKQARGCHVAERLQGGRFVGSLRNTSFKSEEDTKIRLGAEWVSRMRADGQA
jgi:hypothetical protein